MGDGECEGKKTVAVEEEEIVEVKLGGNKPFIDCSSSCEGIARHRWRSGRVM